MLTIYDYFYELALIQNWIIINLLSMVDLGYFYVPFFMKMKLNANFVIFIVM